MLLIEGSAGGDGKFGYRVEVCSDGRTEVHEPRPIEVIFKRSEGLFIATGVLLVILIAALTLPRHSSFGAVVGLLAFAGFWVPFFVGPRLIFDRGWLIGKGQITRYWELKGIRARREWPYQISGLEIRHEVWTNDEGTTDSVIGTESVGELTFVKYHTEIPPSKAASMLLQDRITPEVWWLGHQIAKASGFPLKIEEATIHDPIWWTRG